MQLVVDLAEVGVEAPTLRAAPLRQDRGVELDHDSAVERPASEEQHNYHEQYQQHDRGTSNTTSSCNILAIGRHPSMGTHLFGRLLDLLSSHPTPDPSQGDADVPPNEALLHERSGSAGGAKAL